MSLEHVFLLNISLEMRCENISVQHSGEKMVSLITSSEAINIPMRYVKISWPVTSCRLWKINTKWFSGVNIESISMKHLEKNGENLLNLTVNKGILYRI